MDISPARQLSISNSLNEQQMKEYLQALDKRITALEENLNVPKTKDTIRRTRVNKDSGKDVSSS